MLPVATLVYDHLHRADSATVLKLPETPTTFALGDRPIL